MEWVHIKGITCDTMLPKNDNLPYAGTKFLKQLNFQCCNGGSPPPKSRGSYQRYCGVYQLHVSSRLCPRRLQPRVEAIAMWGKKSVCTEGGAAQTARCMMGSAFKTCGQMIVKKEL